MATYPIVGDWYQQPGGYLFEVVALDEQDATVEIQHFVGTVEEIELDAWNESLFENAEAPEDWSGSVDMDPAVALGPDACLEYRIVTTNTSPSELAICAIEYCDLMSDAASFASGPSCLAACQRPSANVGRVQNSPDESDVFQLASVTTTRV